MQPNHQSRLFSAAGWISSGNSTASAARASPADAPTGNVRHPHIELMRYWALVTAATSWSVLHTIVYDWSRDTHNRSIGAADADLSAAAKLATYSAISAELPWGGPGTSVTLGYSERGRQPTAVAVVRAGRVGWTTQGLPQAHRNPATRDTEADPRRTPGDLGVLARRRAQERPSTR